MRNYKNNNRRNRFRKNGSKQNHQKVWNVISDLKNKGVEQTLKNLTTRWFTDD